ncbi:MAG: HAD family hydrolase [Candidatus Aenigmarchaeota archaeon]|nr:HAD family hydrolase [Candidatus Aenigmarchaeota archaeon]
MVERSDRIKYISFDLDGTLIDSLDFEISFWNETIPRIFSKQHNVPFSEAKKIVLNAYRKFSKEEVEWHIPEYWFKKFKLKDDWTSAIKDLKDRIKIFPEVKRILRKLSKKYKLVLLTHSLQESVELKMAKLGIQKYFYKIFSAIEDFSLVKYDERVYKILIEKLRINAKELVHVGDDHKCDYSTPRRIGIRAILIDRSGKRKGKDIIHDLTKIESIL